MPRAAPDTRLTCRNGSRAWMFEMCTSTTGTAIVATASRSATEVWLKPAGFSHTSVALRDAVSAIAIPVIEVHISNIHAREPFRHVSLVSGAARGTIAGLGTAGYGLAMRYLVDAAA